MSVFRPSDGVWYLNQSFSGFAAHAWGFATDTPIPDDFDGDGKSDIAVFRPEFDGAIADYFILQSATFDRPVYLVGHDRRHRSHRRFRR